MVIYYTSSFETVYTVGATIEDNIILQVVFHLNAVIFFFPRQYAKSRAAGSRRSER